MAAGRIVLVTGAAQGLGRGIAQAFAGKGDFAIVADRDAAGAERTAAELSGQALPLDISDAAAVSAAIAAVLAEHGRIDVLVNNAGVVGGGGLLADLDVAVLDAALAVNVRGTFLMTQAVARPMMAARSGVIVNVSSIGARQPTPGMGHYEATKAAVDAITRTTAIELAPYGIRANAVAPGPVITPLTAGLAENPEARAAWERRIPLGTIAEVAQIAPAALFLASPEASHITGVSLALDGGQLLA
ncbi:3-oxoacyl-ACP reductase [Youhaiella tibetensis]|uniref:SDR family oxidoreductase n=1 Tax=Paradevosia tibetensis TaxID=1447062 RepID=A0A5B9DP48_9HYPH|nr:SDR family NAD(P)-dependent oxidoreductase [Youhaiella tibetensis]QEE20288.1 SDR family oxidoreductase [Youhaiella tibetensis]GGF25435.1 3-oxoacyl-ACP reductase [Youhaiella tibetensis]